MVLNKQAPEDGGLEQQIPGILWGKEEVGGGGEVIQELEEMMRGCYEK